MEKSYLQIKVLLQKSHRDQAKSILFYVYYGGHGILDNTTKIVLNEEDPEFRYFDLEQGLARISKLKNNFVTAIFDCCRKELPRISTRGPGDAVNTKNVSDQNFFIIFGCPPFTGVDAKSTIVKSYTACVMQHLKKTGGVLKLPAALDYRFKAKFEKTSTERREVTR